MIAEKLKKAVIQAAIQGKLTEQLLEDGDAKYLYEAILSKREYLISKKLLKKEKVITKVVIDDLNFDIPETWKWVKLGMLINLKSGQDMSPDRYHSNKTGIPYITGASNLVRGKIILNRWTDSPKSIAKKGDLLITCKGTIGEMAFLNETKAHIARQIMSITPISEMSIQFIKYFLMIQIVELNRRAKSIIPGIDRKTILNYNFPLPPFEEQNRIVGKLDIILPMIEDLEKHEKILEKLMTKFPNRIVASILQAAIQGKLTEQVFEDGPPCIRVFEKKDKKIIQSINNIPFDIPEDWIWERLGNIVFLENGLKYSGEYYPYLEVKYLRGTKDKVLRNSGRFIPKNSRIILVDGENSGEIFITSEDGYMGSTFRLLRLSDESIWEYLWYLLLFYKQTFKNSKTGSAIPHLNKGLFKNLLVPIPPLAEQKRIVQKLESLLPLINSILHN